MNPAVQTHEQLTAEVAELRGRLAEASETLNAIRSGDVDAVLVQGPQGDQLFTLKGADEPYRVLIEEMNQGAVTLSADGSILYCNRRFADLLKTPLDGIVGFAFDAFVAPSEHVAFVALLEAARTGGSAGEITLRAGDASTVPLQLALGPLPADSAAAICLVATDISERKRFERALQKTNVELESAKSVAEKANLAKSDFLSSMSHELRSPLNAILGFAQLMESASPAPTASQTARLAQILQAGWYLLKLINEILDLTVIESGQALLSKESVSLAEVMSECQSMMEPQAQQRGIRVTFPRFDQPIFVRADMTRLKQIVINLLSNAINYNKEHGTVVVDCTVSAPERIRISVKDTGAGLSAEKLAQLFQPFNRLGQEAGGVAGTGIGLVVTKRLAELMDGVLGVESTPGEGSVFWCELTSAAAPQLKIQGDEFEASDRPQLSTGAQRTLLYVEDNPANMELVEQLIERCPDLRMITAVNGTLGVELARATQPDAILMDINLPGISGIKALKILRGDPATARIPVIALSANAMPRDIEKGLEVGFFRYLTKPIKIKELMDTLNEALEFADESADQVTNEGVQV